MKKELHPGVIIAILVIVLAGVAAFFIKRSSPPTDKVDVQKLDPKDLRDEDPIRRGQPGYQERITDAPAGQTGTTR